MIRIFLLLALFVRPGVASTPKDSINKVIKANVRAFRDCYQRSLDRDPKGGGGKVVLAVVIDAAGVVKSVRVGSSTLKDSAVEACLVREMLKLKFPPDEPAKFDYPFLFSSA